MKELTAIVRHLTAPNFGGGVLATLVTVAGSSYRRPGARLFIGADGSRIGAISGGCLEEDIVARARGLALPEVAVYDTTAENDMVWGVGLGCHGVVQVLLERVPLTPAWATRLATNISSRKPTSLSARWRTEGSSLPGTRLSDPSDPSDAGVFWQVVEPPRRLVIFGAGDDARPLARYASDLGWSVIVADPRGQFATAGRFPEAEAVVVAPAEALVARVGPEPGAFAVVMTHHYVHDFPILRDLIGLPLGYLGLLGPRKRGEKMLEDLGRDGNAEAGNRERLHTPVGLDIGAETPEEVALAILAEIQATLAGRDGRPLRERIEPIH